NGLDDDCDILLDEGFPDQDLDGLKNCVDGDDDGDSDPDATDCAALDPAIHAGAPEACNGLDDDCNGAADEGLGTLTCGKGACAHSVPACWGGQPQFCNPFEGSSVETCDGLDNDCDGPVDEDLGVLSCGLGECMHQVAACVEGQAQVCDPFAGSSLETCDGLDNDCDGPVDEDLGVLSCGQGVCAHQVAACLGGLPQACDPWQGKGSEACNTLDDDCDGETDEENALGCQGWWLDGDSDGWGGGIPRCLCGPEGAWVFPAGSDCDDDDETVNPGATEICFNAGDENCDGSLETGCVFTSCLAIHGNNPAAPSGSYPVDPDGPGGAAAFQAWCDMSFDAGGWTRVADNHPVWGTGWDSTQRNPQGVAWTEALFLHDSGAVHAHCDYPGSLPGCNNLGFHFGGGGTLYGAVNWGSSTCGTGVTTITATTYFTGSSHFKIQRPSSTGTLQLMTLEGRTSCTTSDNPGTAYVDIYIR
ncbi:MAG: hypothetical protein FJ098_16170, partial [Deltaproteobacteria bacterium]|nr:hypothetical protein [Deltaproteobacteria bacterium]